MINAWDRVQLARHPKRPTAEQIVKLLFSDFMELHVDRHYGDDRAIIGGIAMFNGSPVTVIYEEKGKTTAEKIAHNFGMPHPEGYQKARRLMKQAEKFHRPIITIIDTPGAYPGIEAEARGQARAIAQNLMVMSRIKTPIIAIVLSEGGSGGALAIGVADQLLMFENAIYSVLSPEGFASILYKDASKAKDIATMMKLTADDLLHYHIIDRVIPEGEGLHIDIKIGVGNLKKVLTESLKNSLKMYINTRIEKRYQKYRQIGLFHEGETDETDKYSDKG